MIKVNLQEEFDNQLTDLQRGLFRKSETAYYIAYSEFLERYIAKMKLNQ